MQESQVNRLGAIFSVTHHFVEHRLVVIDVFDCDLEGTAIIKLGHSIIGCKDGKINLLFTCRFVPVQDLSGSDQSCRIVDLELQSLVVSRDEGVRDRT